ncbi:MAG: SRPBCC family protein [Bacteroidota bacterium]
MTAIIIIVCVIALLLLIAALMPKEMNVEQTIVIDKPKNEVFDYVKYIKNHDNFSVWAMMDPDMKKEYRGTDGQVGFVYAWDSKKEKNVGTGEQQIKTITDGQSIEHEIRFIKPRQDVAQAKFIFTALGVNQTKVRWAFHSRMKFPGSIMKPLISGMLNKSLVTGLSGLKTILEG